MSKLLIRTSVKCDVLQQPTSFVHVQNLLKPLLGRMQVVMMSMNVKFYPQVCSCAFNFMLFLHIYNISLYFS